MLSTISPKKKNKTATATSSVMSRKQARTVLSYAIAYDISQGMRKCLADMSKDITRQMREASNG